MIFLVLGFGWIFAVCALLFALVAYNMKNPVPYLSLFSLIAFLLSGAIGGFCTAKLKKEEKMGTALFAASFVVVIALVVSWIAGGHVGGNTVLACLSYLASVLLGCVIGLCRRKRRRVR